MKTLELHQMEQIEGGQVPTGGLKLVPMQLLVQYCSSEVCWLVI